MLSSKEIDFIITHIFLLSTSIYDLMLLDVCHFHCLQWSLLNFEHYWDTRAYILDPASKNFNKINISIMEKYILKLSEWEILSLLYCCFINHIGIVIFFVSYQIK